LGALLRGALLRGALLRGAVMATRRWPAALALLARYGLPPAPLGKQARRRGLPPARLALASLQPTHPTSSAA